MSSSASDDAASDLSVGDSSVLSETEGVAPSPRVRRTSSVHTAAAQAIVGRRRTTSSLPLPPPPLAPPPSSRSIRYAPQSPLRSPRVRPLSSGRRPASSSAVRPPPIADAEALAGVAPPGPDRLKHLQLHMEQLQQLYAQEIHKEELAAREVFVQSMCTASITLWRYVSSRGRFYTAVKALVSQYLPASNAKLYQVETHGSDESLGLSLVLADSRVVPVATETADAMGIAGHAVLAASQMSPSHWKKLQKMAVNAQAIEEEDEESVGSASLSSIASPSSSAVSSVDEPSTNRWLDRHADCVMPSTNDHLVLLLPLDRVYQNAGFHADIDLTIKKRELLGSSSTQLLVVVLRDSQRRPISVVEALVSAKKPLKIDFLDAFSSLLAAALEARRSICRPVAAVDGGIRIEIVNDSDQEPRLPEDTTSNMVELEIAPGTKMVVKGAGPHSINPENDLPLLEAAQDAMTTLWGQMQQWELQSAMHSRRSQAHDAFWGDVVDSLVTTDERPNQREACRAALSRLNKGLDGAARVHVLFEGESMEEYAVHTPGDEEAQVLSVEAQYAAMQRAIQTGETFETSESVTAQPVMLAGNDEVKAAVLLLIANPSDEFEALHGRTNTLPLVVKAVQLAVHSEAIALMRTAKEAECLALEDTVEQQKQAQRERNAILQLSESLADATSLEQVVDIVDKHTSCLDDSSRMTLFVAEMEDAAKNENNEAPSLRCVWTMVEGTSTHERVVLYNRDSVTSPRKGSKHRGGMAAFVLEAGAPLSYTPHHDAYDPALRFKMTRWVESTKEQLWYYATPIASERRACGISGVLEVLFTSEDQRDAFADSTFACELIKAVGSFFQLHVWLSQREEDHVRSALEVGSNNGGLWTRWKQFVADWSDQTQSKIDVDAWKASTISAIQALLPAVTHGNILLAESVEETALIDRVKRELRESNGVLSTSLNVLNNTILRSVAVFPLAGEHPIGDETESTRDGLLVLAATGEDAFTDQERCIGSMVARLLGVWWRGRKTSVEADAQITSLRELLDGLERQLAVERTSRRVLKRTLFQLRIVSRLSRVVNSTAIESVEDAIQTAIRAVTDECEKEAVAANEGISAPQKPLWVAVLESCESGADCGEWRLWCGGKERSASIISISGGELEAMLRTQRTREYTPPFSDQIMAVIQTVVGSADEFFVQGSRLFLAPLTTISERRILVVLAGSSEEEDGRLVNETFIEELVQGLDRVLSWHASCRELHHTTTELSDRVAECKQRQESLHKVKTAHDKWSASWRRVTSDVVALGPQCSDQAAVAKLENQLLQDVESNAHQSLTAFFDDRSIAGTVDVKIVVHAHDHDTIQEWLRPHERQELLNTPPRSLHLDGDHGKSTQQQWRCRGGAAMGFFVATMACGDDTSGAQCVSCAVRCEKKPDESNAGEVDVIFDALVKQYLVLAAFVCSILELHRHRCCGNAVASSQTKLIEEKIAVIDGLQSVVKSHQRVERAIQQLLNEMPTLAHDAPSGSFDETLCRVMEEVPNYRLWIGDTKSDTLWTTLSDGSRRIRRVDESSWSETQNKAAIKVDGEHVALVEFTSDSSNTQAEQETSPALKLIASTLQGCFSLCHSRHVIQEQQLTIEAIRRENDERLQRENNQNESLVRHSQHVDGLLRFKMCDQQENAIDWSDVLRQIETDMASAVNEIDAVQMAIVDLNIRRRQVTDVRGASASVPADAVHKCYQAMASTLDVWTQVADAESIVKELQGDTMTDVAAYLFPKMPITEAECVVVVAACMAQEPSGVCDDTYRCYVVTTTLVRLTSTRSSVPPIVTRALETDARLVATTVSNWCRDEAICLRATEAERVSVTTAEELAMAQQWTEFTHRALSESQLLMATTADAMVASRASSITDNSEVKSRVEQFAQSICGCDTQELYAVTEDSTVAEPRQRRLTPIISSSLDKPTESMNALDKLLHQDPSEQTAVVHSSRDGSGCRAISLLRNDECVVGAVVLHWHSQPLPLPNATLELVESMVVPWLTTLVQLIGFSDEQRATREADRGTITSLSQDKAALELEGLELKSHLTQIEQRNASLQDTCQLMDAVFGSVEELVAALTAVANAEEAWETLVKGLTDVYGVEGVQLYERSEASTVISVVVSTLSTADDEILERAIRETPGRGGLVATCLHAAAPQETRVAFQSQFKRVRCVSGSEGHHKCLLVVYESQHTVHQVSAMTDRCVDLAAAMAARRVSELGRIQLQAAAAGALEDTTQDLGTQLQQTTEQLTRERRKNDVAVALHHTLTEDLVGNEIWKSVERSPPSTSFPTAKLVVQWRYLQEMAQRRLRKALCEDATVQLYGVVSAASDGSFVFSLPSTNDQLDGHRKGFFCVALRQLQQQKREWRVMAKCIAKRRSVSVEAKSKSDESVESRRPTRTIFFPVLKYSRSNHEEEYESNNGEDDSASDAAGSSVVGVLTMKSRHLDSLSDDIVSLLQDFADALSPRVEWIARLVNQKQQRGQQTIRPHAPAESHLPAMDPGVQNEARSSAFLQVSEASGAPPASGDPTALSQWSRRTHGDAMEDERHVPDYHPKGLLPAVSSKPVLNSAVATREASQDPTSNQFEAAQEEDEDSEDERRVEHTRQRVHAAVTSALLTFSVRVQSLTVDAEGLAALRSLVMRELKTVWTSSGDDRKQALDSVELFFVLDGVVCDRLDGEPSTSTPTWLQEAARKIDLKGSLNGVRLLKVDACRWMASMSTASCHARLLLAITGSVNLSHVFVTADELHHLPSLLSILHLHVVRTLALQAHAEAVAKQKQLQHKQVLGQLAAVEERDEESKRRARQEEELNLLTMRLLQAPDERAVIQMGLHAMKQWLQCAQVAFHVASALTQHHPHAAEDDAGGTHCGIAMETVLRVHVLSQQTLDHDDEARSSRQLVGTMVARLSDTERQAVESTQHADRKEWLLRLLHRLADAVGAAWDHLRQRQQLGESASHLLMASNEIETLQQQVEELQDVNSRLSARVDELEQDVEDKDAVVEVQNQLQREVEELRSGLELSEAERRDMATQLKRYETQLVEVNCQLEQSIRVETQLIQLEQVHAATQTREARLERKMLKQKLQLKQFVAELTSRRDKAERDQAELVELRRQVAVLMEKQQHTGRMDATSVATAVMQAQAQVHQSQAETKYGQQQRMQSAVQRRLLRQMQLQQQTQKQKQLDLAQELKQLAAMEVREMQRRTVEQREKDVAEQWQRIRSQSPTKAARTGDGAPAKVHNVRSQSQSAVVTTATAISKTSSGAAVASKLRPPIVVVAARRDLIAKAKAAIE